MKNVIDMSDPNVMFKGPGPLAKLVLVLANQNANYLLVMEN